MGNCVEPADNFVGAGRLGLRALIECLETNAVEDQPSNVRYGSIAAGRDWQLSTLSGLSRRAGICQKQLANTES